MPEISVRLVGEAGNWITDNIVAIVAIVASIASTIIITLHSNSRFMIEKKINIYLKFLDVLYKYSDDIANLDVEKMDLNPLKTDIKKIRLYFPDKYEAILDLAMKFIDLSKYYAESVLGDKYDPETNQPNPLDG